MAFTYWRTGTSPANLSSQGTQRNNGFDNYGYQFVAPPTGNFGRSGWNKWAWTGSSLRTDSVSRILSNGTFDADLAGWIITGGGSAAWQSPGFMRVTGGGFDTLARLPVALVTGQLYRITVNVLATTGQVQIVAGDNSAGGVFNDLLVNAFGPGVVTATFTSTFGPTAAIGVLTTGGAVADYDDIVVTQAIGIAAEAGSYSITGTATGLTAQRRLAAAVGSYSISGTTTALRIARKQVEAVGSYVIIGTATALKADRRLAAAVGSYSITGVATTFKVSMPASVGSYSVTGTAAALRTARRLSGAVGSYSITGHATGLSVKLSIASGSYSVTGTSVNLTYHTATTGVIQATPGVYSLTGIPAGLKWGRHLRPARGTYALTGTEIDLIYDSLWNADTHPREAGWTPSPAIAAGLWTREPGPTQLEWSN